MRLFCVWMMLLASVGGSMGCSLADDWRGFRGADRQGWAAAAAGPVEWSTNRNIVWKTPIAGQGHSSPIVVGESVYVTTAYASPGHQRWHRSCQWAIGILGGLLLAHGLWRLGGIGRTEARWRVLFAVAFSAAVAVIAWWGRGRFGLETHDVRAWQASMVVLIGCLGIAGMAFPIESRAWVGVGLVAVLSTIPAYLLFPEPDELRVIDSASSVVSVVLMGSPFLGGMTAWLLHYRARRRAAARPVTSAGGMAWLGVGLALMMAALYVYEANHLRRTKSIVRAVVCLDLEDGHVRWTLEGLPGQQRPLTAMNTAATPTPVADGDRILAWFASAGLMCVSTNGDLLWVNRELVSEPKYGTASSPVVHDGVAVLVSDVEESEAHEARPRSWIAGVDIRTGQILWRAERRGHRDFATYATPVVQAVAGSGIVWVYGWHGIEGYELHTGKSIGRHAHELAAHHLAASPALEGERLFVPGAKAHVCLDLGRLRAGGDPLIWTAAARGEISASPAVAKGLVFVVDESGLASCLDMATGRKHWEKRLAKRHFASVAAIGDTVYFCSELGRTTAVRRSPEFGMLAENDLGEKVYASFAVAGERLIIRGTEHVYCVSGNRSGP